MFVKFDDNFNNARLEFFQQIKDQVKISVEKDLLKGIEHIDINKPDAIFVWELSRLTRRAIKVQRYIDRFSVLPKIPMYFADYDVWTLDEKTKKTEDDNIMMLVGGAKSVERILRCHDI